jgi:integrase
MGPAPLLEIYTAEAIQALLEHAGESRLLFLTLLQAGLRAGEASHLRPENLLDRGVQVTPHNGW